MTYPSRITFVPTIAHSTAWRTANQSGIATRTGSRTVDWEAVRSQLSDTTVRFAVGAADAESAADGLTPFEALSGIKVELVPIPDDSMYDKVVAEFISGNAAFDALQFFSPWMGDFAAPGFLYPLDDFADKWGLPLDDFYDTYRLNYGFFNGKMYGIPFDCDIQMVHLRKGYMETLLGGPVDKVNSIPTYDELIRVSKELNKIEPGVSGVGLMVAPGFWSTYTWEHIAAQAGMMLFDENWEPIFNGDAGMKGLETILELAKNANEGHAGAGWPENRAAWLGGQVATNISWQDSGTQAMRPDQSQIVDDFVTIYEPRIEGGRFAPPNIAGSTSCVAASAQKCGRRILDAWFLDDRIDHGDERGQRQRRRAGIQVGAGKSEPAGSIATRQSMGRFVAPRMVLAALAGCFPDRTGDWQRNQPSGSRADNC